MDLMKQVLSPLRPYFSSSVTHNKAMGIVNIFTANQTAAQFDYPLQK